ncbi:MAG: hypothetical protein ACLTWO_02250 [Blautia massiliensis (ex Durand et al. 2017)]|nr:MAG: hypothetical protein DBX91_01035 [Subdoligranulum variabile]
MQQLTIDTGVEEFCINGRGVLRFNPADPNLYHRFFDAGRELEALDKELERRAAELPEGPAGAEAGLALLAEYDARIKALLGGVFGPENDFDAVLGGVNLAGAAANGKRVVQNLLEALTPILQQGAQRHLEARAAAAEAGAAAARAARGAV